MSAAKHARAVELMRLPHGARVLDIGAGKGTLLLDIIERYNATGVAVEPAALFADELEKEARRRNLLKALTVVRTPAQDFLSPSCNGSFDGVLCVGATHAIGSIHDCVSVFTRLLRPGGHALWGEGYWKAPPPADYLAALGAKETSYLTHAGNLELLVKGGLTPIWAMTASDDEWDEYEWSYARGIRDFVLAQPQDPDAPVFLERSNRWRGISQTWGRGTLGFAFYLSETTLPNG